MNLEQLAWWIILLPLIGAVAGTGLALAKVRRGADWLAILTVAGSAAISLMIFKHFFDHPDDTLVSASVAWIELGGFWVNFSLRIDSLAAVMVTTVTTVSLLVIIYSRGYMSGEEGFNRYFAQISLFVASMCILVLGGNFLMLFLGWEGVGLCSFMLIGFWYTRPAAASAAVKAFVVTRIGDTGFAIGLFLIVLTFGTVDFATVFQQAGTLSSGLATAISLLLLAGAVGKSAQIPLYVWLPDAMEGPTPVSALIHAATMVTAGVYLIARCGSIFIQSPIAMDVVAIIGAVTAIYAALIALGQFDIKRILAYSTISQIGYMFLAIGILTPGAGIFHLGTHAWFKALLFLTAGAIMHAMDGVIDIREIGGLRRVMPVVYWLFLIAALTISGIFPFSGFWSKDEIIGYAWTRWPVLGVLAWLTSLLTTLYIFRIFFLVFHGPEKLPARLNGHPHKIGGWMIGPMIVLAVGSMGLGYLFLHPIEHILHPSLAWSAEPGANPILYGIITTGANLLMILVAWKLYRPERVVQPIQPLSVFNLLNRKFYVDELYGASIVAPTRAVAEGASQTDDTVIDGILAILVAIPKAMAKAVRTVQTGALQSYALGVIVLLAVMLLTLIKMLG